jgi:hypothetical protein
MSRELKLGLLGLRVRPGGAAGEDLEEFPRIRPGIEGTEGVTYVLTLRPLRALRLVSVTVPVTVVPASGSLALPRQCGSGGGTAAA